jgi:hypothetical protein
MQVEYSYEDSMTFKITNNGDNAIDVFNSILRKCRKEASKKGFNNMFNSEEKAFIKEFTEAVLSDKTKALDNEVRY